LSKSRTTRSEIPKKAASTYGTPAPADRDERERRLLDAYLAKRERDSIARG
jgi:hypothetical protein